MSDPPQDPGFADGVDRLYAENVAVLVQAALTILGNLDDANDAVHEVFLKLPRDFADRIETSGRLPYLVRAVKNQATSRSVRGRKTVSLDESQTTASSRSLPHLSKKLLNRPVRDVIAATLRDLPRGQRHAIRLTMLRGFPRREAADRLGIRIKALEKRITAGKRRIRASLASRGFLCWDDVSSNVDGGGKSLRRLYRQPPDQRAGGPTRSWRRNVQLEETSDVGLLPRGNRPRRAGAAG